MKKTRIDLSGKRFGRLTVLRYDHTDKCGHGMWLCQCDCGNKKIVIGGNLKSGNSKSCGCLHNEQLAERTTTHGCYGTRLYWIWAKMKSRCMNYKDKYFADYGGRGITVCDEWLKFEDFQDWAMANGYTDELTIDRIDVNGNYEPSNCRWATRMEQTANRRVSRCITFDGKTKTISQWAAEYGLNYYTLYSRVKRGWPIEEALQRGAWANK